MTEPNLKLDASDWLAAVCDDSFGASEARLLESWLAESEVNRHQFAILASKASNLSALAEIAEIKRFRADALDRLRARRPKIRAVVLTIALFTALAASGIFWEFNSHTLEIETALGQMTSVTLTDGSVVEVNSATNIEVRFDPLQRRVRLLEGEANFRVRPQRWRPFTVKTSELNVRAVGTVFAVAELPHEARVVVSEGRVQVDTLSRRVESLAAGRKLVYSRQSKTISLFRAQLDQDLAWREGRIRSDGKPLNELLRDLARYSTTRIDLADAALGDLSISGDFDPRDPGSFARAVAKLHSLAISQSGPDHILLGPKQ